MKTSNSLAISIVAMVIGGVFSPMALGQGSLTPSAAPSPTMRTLQQVEPRTPISSLPYIINDAGSYYLTQSLTGSSGSDGITINADNVTLDMAGFSMVGMPGSLSGIQLGSPRYNVAIRNGTIELWDEDGIDGDGARNCLYEDLRIQNNDGTGLRMGYASRATGCAVYASGSNGYSTVEGCLIESCTSSENAYFGFAVAQGDVIRNCVSTANEDAGIQVGRRCKVSGNVCERNGAGGVGAGVSVTGNDNRIEDNHLTAADFGLQIQSGGTNNFIAGNTVLGNTQNYDLVDGNQLNLLLSELPIEINWPATLELAGTLTGVSGTNGITINSDNVTVDLAGHALVGVVGSLDGIHVSATCRNICVRNGKVSSWGGDGVDLRFANQGQVVDVMAFSNGTRGIYVGNDTLIQNCQVSYSGNIGIQASYSCILRDCTSSYNDADGFYVFQDSMAENCIARENGSLGFYVSYATLSKCLAENNEESGITASLSTISHCTVIGNGGHGISLYNDNVVLDSLVRNNSTNGVNAGTGCTISRVSVIYNGDNGILADEGCTISDCTVTQNTGDGIEVNEDCRVVGNTCEENGRNTGSGAGIYATGSDNRIEGNAVTDCDRGIQVDAVGNFIVKNTASGNSTEFAIVGGNWTGPLDTSSAGTITNMSPWANFQF